MTTLQYAYLQLQNVALPYIRFVTTEYLNMIFCRPGKMLFKDIVDDEGFDLHKTDLIHVQLSKNSNAVDTECFKPDMKDILRVVKNFNSSLKFVKFQIDRNENVGFNNNTSGCCSKESETGRTAFTVLMSGASAKKFPELNDVNNNSHRFTGLLFH